VLTHHRITYSIADDLANDYSDFCADYNAFFCADELTVTCAICVSNLRAYCDANSASDNGTNGRPNACSHCCSDPGTFAISYNTTQFSAYTKAHGPSL
jgi:hypothetical protein